MNWGLYIFFLIVTVSVSIFINYKRTIKQNNLYHAISTSNLKEFDDYAKGLTTLFFSKKYLARLRLDLVLKMKNAPEIEKTLKECEKYMHSQKEKTDLYLKAFNYYMPLKNKEKCLYYHDKIKTLKDKSVYKEIDRAYLICFEGNTSYEEELLKEINEMDPKFAGVDEYILSCLYRNLNNRKKEEQYLKLSKQHIEELAHYYKVQNKQAKKNKK